MKERKGTSIKEFNHKGVNGRSLTTLEEVRNSQIKAHTKAYNAQYEGRAIFTESQVLLIMFDTDKREYRSRPLDVVHLKHLWVNRKGKFNNNRKVRV